MKRKALIVTVLSIICFVTLMTVCFRSAGGYFGYFFWQDEADTGMDFYNSLAETAGGDPYGTFHTVYPPFSNALFYTMQTMVPSDVKDSWPRYHEGIVALRRTQDDLRTVQSTDVQFLFCTVLYVFLSSSVIIWKFRKNVMAGIGLAFAALVSYGSLTAIERGNIIALTMVLTMIFIFGYDSPLRSIRILSCCSLVAASAIKLYPAVYFLLMLDGKKRRSSLALYTVCSVELGAILSITPLLLFGGLRDLGLFLKILTGFNSAGGNDAFYYRYGMRGIAEHISMSPRLHSLLLISDPVLLYRFMLAVSSAVLLYAALKHMRAGDDPCEAAFDLTVLMILVQTQSSDYTLCFFVPVLMLMVYDRHPLNTRTIPYFIMLLVFTLPYVTSPIRDETNMVLHHVDIIQFTLLCAVAYEFMAYIALPAVHVMRLLLSRIFFHPHRFA